MRKDTEELMEFLNLRSVRALDLVHQVIDLQPPNTVIRISSLLEGLAAVLMDEYACSKDPMTWPTTMAMEFTLAAVVLQQICIDGKRDKAEQKQRN